MRDFIAVEHNPVAMNSCFQIGCGRIFEISFLFIVNVRVFFVFAESFRNYMVRFRVGLRTAV